MSEFHYIHFTRENERKNHPGGEIVWIILPFLLYNRSVETPITCTFNWNDGGNIETGERFISTPYNVYISVALNQITGV